MVAVTGVARVTFLAAMAAMAAMTFVAVAAVIVHLVAADDGRLIVSAPRMFGGCPMSGMSSATRSHDPTIYP
ncbi:hypothetical protein C8K38_10465 [Rhodococcus sp. OK611]|nr:hypothetical protein C8K38_10465 [Rhodococcus sp. OK611]SNX89672.1 hypothetical protein SAMN05447004_10364 [Rhodococcus sp. OK270]